MSFGRGEGGQERSLLFARDMGIGASKKLVKLAQGPFTPTINKPERRTERKENMKLKKRLFRGIVQYPTTCLAQGWTPSGGGPPVTRCLGQCWWAILIGAIGDKH